MGYVTISCALRFLVMGWNNKFGAGLLTATSMAVCALLATGCNPEEDSGTNGTTNGEASIDAPPELDPALVYELTPDQFTEMALAPVGLDEIELTYVDEPFLFDNSSGLLYVATIEFSATWAEIAAKIEEHRSDSTARISVEENVLVFEDEGNWYSLTQHREEDGKTFVNIQFNVDRP